MPAKAFIKQGGNILKIPTQALQVLGKNAIYIPHAKRVASDSGTIDNPEQAKNFCEVLNNNDSYLNVNLAWNFHTGKKITKLYSVYPNNGSGDLTVTRPNQRIYFDKFNNLTVAANNEPVIDYSDTEPSLIVTANDSIKLPSSGLNEAKSVIINNKAYTFPSGRNINGLRLPLNPFSLAYRHRDRVYFDGGGTLSFNDCKTANQAIKNGAVLYWDINTGFKTGKIYSLNKSGTNANDFTVSRNSSSVRINEGIFESVASNVPVIDIVNGQHILQVLPQATNFVENNCNWNTWISNTNTTITDSGIASPVSGVNWPKITANAGTFISRQACRSNGAFSVTPNQTYAQSLWIKKGNHRWVYIRIGGHNCGQVIDLDNNTIYRTIESVPGTIISSNIIFNNEFVEHKIIVKNTTTQSAPVIIYFLKNPDITFDAIAIPANETFNGTEFVYALAGQFELSTHTRLIITGGATQTRLADQISTTPPSGVSKIIEYFADNTNREITSIPGIYTLETGKEYKKIEMT